MAASTMTEPNPFPLNLQRPVDGCAEKELKDERG
jgi:hypothetical protein